MNTLPHDLQSFLKNELNEPQRQAVTAASGAIMVIAGAGSGKTRVITARIAYLIAQCNVSPSSIIALTFTNKAAGEMKERIGKFLSADIKLPFIGTFHGYAHKLLRMYPQLTGFDGDFSIIDSDDQRAMLKKILKDHALEKKMTPTQAASAVSAFKSTLSTTGAEPLVQQPFIADLYKAYESEKYRQRGLDFDDMLIAVLKGFSTHPNIVKILQNNLRHILIDEFQDTNAVQHMLIKKLAFAADTSGTSKLILDSIAAVGDEDQSIYSWRGAVSENFNIFKKDFGPVTAIVTEQNYRSVLPILDAANSLILNNKGRNKKKLWSEKQADNRILHVMCQSDYNEADSVATCIKRAPASISRGSMAVLYRTNFQSRTLEEALMRENIAYKIIGGIRFYERKEIKDLLAYLRLVVNPYDRVSFFRVLNVPTRGIGAKCEEMLYQLWDANESATFRQLIALAKEQPEFSRYTEGFAEFEKIFVGTDITTPPTRAFDLILERTDYDEYIAKEYDDEAEIQSKRDHIKELGNGLAYFEKSRDDAHLIDYLHDIALLNEKIDDDTELKNTIQLMTLHSAKGLEFDYVIITGLEEGLLPSSRSLDERAKIEEERRLLYVGITRARERLILTHAATRVTYGQMADQIPSRFLNELPLNLITSVQSTRNAPSQFITQFNAWLGNAATKSDVMTFGSDFQFKAKAKPRVLEYSFDDSDPSIHFSTKNTQGMRSLGRRTKQVDESENKNPVGASTKPSFKSSTSTLSPHSLSVFRKKNVSKGETHPKLSVLREKCVSMVWKLKALVKHASFGIGIILGVEKSGDDYLINVSFKTGPKKVLSSFLELM